jgi:hypothetical protein
MTVARVEHSMDRERRRFLAAGGAALAGGLAGCLDAVTGDLEFTADPVRVSEAALRQTGYREVRIAEQPVVREVDVAGVRRSVRVTNWISEYDQGIDLPFGRVQAAVFAALSTPMVRVLGRSFNPLADMNTDELAALVQSRYDAIRDVRPDTDLRVTLLGETVDATRYTGTATFPDSGLSIDVYLYVTAAAAVEDDLVLGVAGHPQLVGPREGPVRTLLAGVERA